LAHERFPQGIPQNGFQLGIRTRPSTSPRPSTTTRAWRTAA